MKKKTNGPLPRIDDVIDSLEVNVCSKLDLTSRYYQMASEEESQNFAFLLAHLLTQTVSINRRGYRFV